MSDKPGRKNPLTYMLEEFFEAELRELMFCLPGKITQFDEESQLAQVECGIQRIVNGNARTIPPISNVPVKFAGDNGWYLWHRITPGETEGLIHFGNRAADSWIDQGGPIAPHESRVLSGDDAFFVPGVRSRPGAIPSFVNDGIGISNYEQSTLIHLTDDGVLVEHGGETLASTIDDLCSLINDTLVQLDGETVTVTSGSSAGSYQLDGGISGAYSDLSVDLQAIQNRLQTLLNGGT